MLDFDINFIKQFLLKLLLDQNYQIQTIDEFFNKIDPKSDVGKQINDPTAKSHLKFLLLYLISNNFIDLQFFNNHKYDDNKQEFVSCSRTPVEQQIIASNYWRFTKLFDK